MAATHIALLRGINVGRAKRIAMADLRELVTNLGYRDVRSLLNSGNVVFTIPRGASRADPAGRIERAIAKRLGMDVRVTVLTAAELATIVRENPLEKIATDPSRLMVTVLMHPADRTKLRPLLKEKWGREKLALGKRACYLWCPRGIIESAAAEATGKVLGDAATTRNWATIQKLHKLASDDG